MRSTAVSGFERKGNARVRVTGREFILDAATGALANGDPRQPRALSKQGRHNNSVRGHLQTGL